MDKQTEIKILKEAAAKLGPDSYCGPWLESQIPFIERDIRADIMPETDWDKAVSAARAEAERIIAEAKAEAERIKKEASDYQDKIIGQVIDLARKIEREANR